MEEENQSSRAQRVGSVLFCAASLLGLLSLATGTRAETPASMKRLNVRRSKHLLVHTDLCGREAQQLLTRLEAKLRVASRYWAKPLRAPIECCVVKNTDYLPLAGAARQDAAMLLRQVGGYADRDAAGKTRLLATDAAGIAEHELIHAYCLSAFRSPGPDWYREGMACYFSQRWNGRAAVHCDQATLDFLHSVPYRSIHQIVDGTKFTDGIASSLKRATRADQLSGEQVGWDASGDRALKKALESYHWSWALCQFLASNKNYSREFRKLGLAYLNGQESSFDDYFAGKREKLEAEFREFAANVCDGYRVDLCRWDFKLDEQQLLQDQVATARVQAGLGWQSSSVSIRGGKCYRLSAAGSWKTNHAGPQIAVARIHDESQSGALIASILHEGELGVPFCVSKNTVITPHQSGLLLFRCNEQWQSLADNLGTIGVKIERTE